MKGRSADRAVIKSHDDFRKVLPRLISQQEKHPRLAIAALANPLLALEELGYAVAPEIRPHMERLARFGTARTAEWEAAAERLAAQLGDRVDIDDPKALTKAVLAKLPKPLLAERLERPAATMATPAAKGAAQTAASPWHETLRDLLADALAELPQRDFRTVQRRPDPLARLAGRHPMVDAVLALREIEASRAQLADPDTFRKILSGDIQTPITRVRFKAPAPQAEP